MAKFENAQAYIQYHQQWAAQLEQLRARLLAHHLDETIKWNSPVYELNGKNLIGLGAFKSYVGMWFYQGALLNDTHKVLINAQEGKTKALRQWRFGSDDTLPVATIDGYIQETIENHQAGKAIHVSKNAALAIPDELEAALSGNPKLKESFDTFGRSKQREFCEYIASAKRENTKHTRLQKILPMIQQNIGLNDKYR